MTFFLFSLFGGLLGFLLNFFQNNGLTFYFYYDYAILVAIIIGIVLNLKQIRNNLKGIDKGSALMLLAIVVAFLAVELIFVHPTDQLYSDEYIHMSTAKVMLYNHLAAQCSFSSGLYCVNGTEGMFQQPTGWPAILSIAFLLFGISFTTAFNTALFLSIISIAVIFYISYLLTKNNRIALLSSLLLAFTPLLLTFSRSAIVDTPESTMMLVAIAFLLTYLTEKRFAAGITAVFAITYTMMMKVDAIVIIPIVLVLLLFSSHTYSGSNARRKMAELAILILLFLIIASPQFIFMYMSWTKFSFGTTVSQPKFSLSYLSANLPQNVNFWTGIYGSVVFQSSSGYSTQTSGWWNYNLEYPTLYTLFAIIGVGFLAYKGKYRETLALGCWFLIIFLFYTAYYAGGVLYSAGDDVRYFLGAFPAVAMLAAVGVNEAGESLADWIGKRAKQRDGNKNGRWIHGIDIKKLILILLVLIIMSDPIFSLAAIVSKPPQDIYAFAAERAEQQFIFSNYNLVPPNCFVLTYEPALWYVLNKSNMYADWILDPLTKPRVLNLSKGCLYFAYSIECTQGSRGVGDDNTQVGCSRLMSNYAMQPVAEAPYDNFGWTITFKLFKIENLKNSSS